MSAKTPAGKQQPQPTPGKGAATPAAAAAAAGGKAPATASKDAHANNGGASGVKKVTTAPGTAQSTGKKFPATPAPSTADKKKMASKRDEDDEDDDDEDEDEEDVLSKKPVFGGKLGGRFADDDEEDDEEDEEEDEEDEEDDEDEETFARRKAALMDEDMDVDEEDEDDEDDMPENVFILSEHVQPGMTVGIRVPASSRVRVVSVPDSNVGFHVTSCTLVPQTLRGKIQQDICTLTVIEVARPDEPYPGYYGEEDEGEDDDEEDEDEDDEKAHGHSHAHGNGAHKHDDEEDDEEEGEDEDEDEDDDEEFEDDLVGDEIIVSTLVSNVNPYVQLDLVMHEDFVLSNYGSVTDMFIVGRLVVDEGAEDDDEDEVEDALYGDEDADEDEDVDFEEDEDEDEDDEDDEDEIRPRGSRVQIEQLPDDEDAPKADAGKKRAAAAPAGDDKRAKTEAKPAPTKAEAKPTPAPAKPAPAAAAAAPAAGGKYTPADVAKFIVDEVSKAPGKKAKCTDVGTAISKKFGVSLKAMGFPEKTMSKFIESHLNDKVKTDGNTVEFK